MSEENQHWLAKFHLRNFVGSDGRLYRMNVQTDEVSRKPPKYAASSAGYNEFVINGQVVSFEDQLEKIETAAAPIIKRIAKSRSLAGLTPKQRKRVADYMAAQCFRTDAFYKGLNFGKEREKFGPVFAQLWRSAFIVSEEIQRRRWALMVIDHDDVFYLGDQPVVLQNTENPGSGGELGLDVKGVEAFFPLTPKCALYMPCGSTSDDRMARYQAAMDLHRVVRSHVLRGLPGGFRELQTAQLVINRLHPLVQAFTRGTPITADPENVENLNCLQCSFAHEFVYSNRRDFAFAKRVFRETPGHRATVKTRLGWLLPTLA
jgi:hypothetical protein